MNELLLAAASAAVGAAATALGGYVSAVYRTQGAIREQAIGIAEFVYRQLHLVDAQDSSADPSTRGTASRDAAAYVHLMGALVTFFIRSIRYAEGKSRIRQCPELPSDMQAMLNERFALVRDDLLREVPAEDGDPSEEDA